MACETRQESDEMVCRCGLRWDVNDPDPPVCQKSTLRAARDNFLYSTGAVDGAVVEGSSRKVRVAPIPLELSDELAFNMAKAYEANRDSGFERTKAIQAAYRVFLDSLP